MKFLVDDLRVARSIKRGIAILFAVGGALRLMFWDGLVAGPEGPLTALLLIGVGAGVWLNWRVARWLAMGACFLTLVGAAAVPLLLLTVDFPDPMDMHGRRILMFAAVTATFALLAYKGLQYFRSDLALEEFSANLAQQNRMAKGGSRFTLYAAGLWVFLILLLTALHASYEMRHMKAASANGVDLVPEGLCREGISLVKLEIENRGRASGRRLYRVTYSSLGIPDEATSSMARVPSAGSDGQVTLGNARDQRESRMRTMAVKVNVDAGNVIAESDETNNVRWFDIEFRDGEIANLRPCNSPARGEGITSLDPN